MIQESRVMALNGRPPARGDYVLYWMQASQRVEQNHALEYAIRAANEAGLPLVVYFGLTGSYPSACMRHYSFMLDGLAQVKAGLADRGIPFVMRHVEPPAGAVELSRRAAIVVTDRGYTRIQRLWRATAAERIDCPLIQVESDIVVPVETASNKEETAARTLRPKIHREMHNYLIPVEETEVRRKVRDAGLESLDPAGGDELLRELGLNKGPGRVDAFAGGTARARELLEMFIASKLDRYDADRNDPCLDGLSDLSPYIHFGQISPVYVAIRVQDARSPGTAAFLEELIIRRELAVNFVHHNEGYNSFQGLPRWCRETLMEHGMDERPYTYSLEQLEQARTHDPYWNSAQTQMVKTGKMHGYMRMYWGKKIMEWTGSVEDAYSIALYLNDRFELDGRDPNGYAGVAWCFGKHDRPWAARPVFGSIRYMNDKGLKRKFDADAYVTKVKALK